MLLPVDTLILTIRGHRPLFSLPQGTPVVSRENGKWVVRPLDYKAKRKEISKKKFKRVRLNQQDEQMITDRWTASGGYNQWLTVPRKAKILTLEGQLIPLTTGTALIYCTESSFGINPIRGKYEWTSIERQALTNVKKNIPAKWHKHYGDLTQLNQDELTKEIPFVHATTGRSTYKVRPAVNKTRLLDIIDHVVDYSVIAKVNHGIVTNGLYLE